MVAGFGINRGATARTLRKKYLAFQETLLLLLTVLGKSDNVWASRKGS